MPTYNRGELKAFLLPFSSSSSTTTTSHLICRSEAKKQRKQKHNTPPTYNLYTPTHLLSFRPAGLSSLYYCKKRYVGIPSCFDDYIYALVPTTRTTILSFLPGGGGWKKGFLRPLYKVVKKSKYHFVMINPARPDHRGDDAAYSVGCWLCFFVGPLSCEV